VKNNIHTISASAPFADTLARWVLGRWGHAPLTLSRALILLPSRRAAMSLREAFLRASGGAPLLLPRIEPLGDADEDAPHLFSLASSLPQDIPAPEFTFRRLFLLARLTQRQREQLSGKHERMDHALALAAGLAELMDELEREEISLDGMARIVPDAFALHWQATVEFLQILSTHWPHIAKEQGLISSGRYRGEVLRALALHWRQSPPETPVIAAGTTGSIPATAALLAAIHTLPQGHIVLPGLDVEADDAYFELIDESHPQWGMAQLLKKLGCARADVQVMGPPPTARARLISEVMRPAEISDAWRAIKLDKARAVEGMRVIDCAHAQEEASVIALLLREALERPGKTAALVTHNRALARRVAAIMRRFGVTIDDSAGMPLMETPPAVFLRLVLGAASEALAPLPLLSLLKHPLAHAGMERIACLEAARALEMLALRGLRPEGGVEGMRQALVKGAGAPPQVHALLDRLDEALTPLLALFAQKQAPLLAFVEAHIACAEALGGGDLWNGHEAETLSQLLADARAACEADGLAVEAEAYPAIFEELLAGSVVRPQFGMHPRLKILGPMEARMQSFDRMILGGLNEGSWPPAPRNDPWFSRPMRATLGLPSPERQVGLAAHDFTMLASASEVILTRAGKEDGVPAQPSRWLVKLDMLAGGLPRGDDWLAWARMLDTPDMVQPMKPPAPKPPLAARPRKISVTQVETWMRDPYALYASQILRLKPLEPLGRAPDGSDFGKAVHKALERFTRAHAGRLPADALAQLLRYGSEAFGDLFAYSGMEMLWWPRFTRIAQWVIAQEELRAPLARVGAEVEGNCRIGDFLLQGRADRIEEKMDGSLAIIDYKTGGLPLMKDIEDGLSSQLVLLALIAREGSGKWTGAIALEYWQLLGGEEAGTVKTIDADKAQAYVAAAKEGLARLIARYDNADFPYRSTPIPARAGRYNDYWHLARVKEWG